VRARRFILKLDWFCGRPALRASVERGAEIVAAVQASALPPPVVLVKESFDSFELNPQLPKIGRYENPYPHQCQSQQRVIIIAKCQKQGSKGPQPHHHDGDFAKQENPIAFHLRHRSIFAPEQNSTTRRRPIESRRMKAKSRKALPRPGKFMIPRAMVEPLEERTSRHLEL